jgi:hypothetical protein
MTHEETKPTPEKRFVQRSLQSVARWSPLGGSSFAFATFLMRQDWAIALLLFPVTAVSGVWAAYSKNFVERLSEIYGERGKGDADKLVAWGDSLNEALKWQFSGFDAKYLKCQRLDCHEDDPVGVRFDDDIVVNQPLLQEVFVPLRLSSDSVLAGYSGDSDRLEAGEDCRIMMIWDLLRQVRQKPAYRQIAIRAWGGYGKTTLLKHLAYNYSGREYCKYGAPKLVPFLLYLARCQGELVKMPDLPELLTQYHLSRLPQGKGLTAPPKWATYLLEQGNALVMFDGFDEVPKAERAAVSDWISEQMRQYPESVFILTSRPTAYKEDYSAKRPTASFWVEDFNPDQRRRFVEQWYLCQERHARGGRNTPDVQLKAQQNAEALLTQIAARPELEAIAGNVLLLNMMARFYRDKQGAELPQRKVELYQDICELQLGRRAKAKGISLLLTSLSQRQEVLQIVALAMMQRAASDKAEFKQIGRDDLLGLMAPALNERDREVSVPEFLEQVVQVSELLVEQEGKTYEFSHLSFQEYLAAVEIVRLKQEETLYDKLELSAWKATILFYANLVNPTRLLREVMSRQQADLAYEILRENSRRVGLLETEKIELQALLKTVKAARYAKLEECLQNQQWVDADQETYRLMITTVGKEVGQIFEKEELLNFPCDALRAIDGLWVKYSNGHFGFSVQKQIYVECGGKLDGKYPGEKVWEAFGDRVGWREEGKWRGMNYKALTKDIYLSAHHGKFPCFVLGWLGGGVFVFSSLAQRLVNCSTPQS